jgi:hypothetical protein
VAFPKRSHPVSHWKSAKCPDQAPAPVSSYLARIFRRSPFSTPACWRYRTSTEAVRSPRRSFKPAKIGRSGAVGVGAETATGGQLTRRGRRLGDQPSPCRPSTQRPRRSGTNHLVDGSEQRLGREHQLRCRRLATTTIVTPSAKSTNA